MDHVILGRLDHIFVGHLDLVIVGRWTKFIVAHLDQVYCRSFGTEFYCIFIYFILVMRVRPVALAITGVNCCKKKREENVSYAVCAINLVLL